MSDRACAQKLSTDPLVNGLAVLELERTEDVLRALVLGKPRPRGSDSLERRLKLPGDIETRVKQMTERERVINESILAI